MSHLVTHNAMPVAWSKDRWQGMATAHGSDTLLGGSEITF